MSRYYERGVFIDQGSFVCVRLWRGGVKVRDFSLLRPKSVKRADGSVEVQFSDHPASAAEAAARWASVVNEVLVNPQ